MFNVGDAPVLGKTDLESLERMALEIPEPKSFFKGIASAPFELPNNLVLFQRPHSGLLGQEHHYHYRFVLIVNIKTDGIVVLDNRSFDLRSGEALLVFPHQFHHFLAPRSGSIRWLFITFELNHAEHIISLRNRVNPLSAVCRLYLSRLVDLYSDGLKAKPDFPPSISLHAGLVLQELLQQEGRTSNRAAITAPPLIDQLNRYIWDNFDQDLKLTDLAGKFHYSESHLRVLFRKRMGMSLGTYILRVKMNRARSLLINPGLNVSQVAQACGYDSLYSFSRAFKNSTGLSPLAYKKVNAKNY
jgi:AraC-like DNA-binding protein